MLRKAPIRVKLTLIAGVSTILALLVAFAGFLYYDLTSFKSKLAEDLRTEADVIGENCSAALTFRDRNAAVEVLKSLRHRPQVETAAVYGVDGHLFATCDLTGTGREGVPDHPLSDSTLFTEGGISVFRTIHSDTDAVGVLFIHSGMGDWYARRNSFIGIMGALILLCAGISLGVAGWLQRMISVPIHELAATMRAVASEERYDRRVQRKTDDEIGQLVEGFNSMLAEIEERDRELHEANDDLEVRVQRRTAELEREIVERRAAEVLLTKSQQSLADFFDNATVGLHWLGPDGTVLRANRAELKMLGYSEEEYVGRNIADFHEDRAVIRDILARLAKGETIRSYQARMRCKDGKAIEVTIESSVLWEGDKFVHTRCFTRDMSAQIEAQRARFEREQAQKANVAKSEFLSRMSHELRTPMNAIMGFSQLLAMDELSADQRDSIDRLMSAGKHLLKLINEVLDISRIESGNLAISKEPVKVSEVVSEVLSLVRPLGEEKRVVVLSRMDREDDTHVMADRQRLRQVLLNLVSNAIKYNVENGDVRIETELIESGLRIVVADSGPGIAKDKLALIFTPFERLGAENSGIEGTGLGLAVSKRLCEAMGAKIGLLDTQVGASFFLDIPLAESPLRAFEAASGMEDAPAVGPIHRGSVLLIEDNLSNVKLMEKVLGLRAGVSLTVSLTGEGGISAAEQNVPDLILLDLNLPDIHGEKVLHRLRGSQVTADIPVVVVSADATPSQVDRLKAAGALDYLTKPVDVAALLQLIDTQISWKVKQSA